MKLNDPRANIFETMRLVLPEHRAVMKSVTQETSRHVRPVLTEDQYQEMQYLLGEALEAKQPIRLHLYHPYDTITYQGVPFMKNNQLCVKTEQGDVQIPVSDILQIQDV